MSFSLSHGKGTHHLIPSSGFHSYSDNNIINTYNGKNKKIKLSNSKTNYQDQHSSVSVKSDIAYRKLDKAQSEIKNSMADPIINCISDQTASTDAGAATYTHSDRSWDPEVINVPTPAYLNTANWSSTASRGSTSTDEVRVFGEQRLRLAYNGNGVPRNGTYTFSTTADASGTISFDWFLNGCHSFFLSNANFRLWVGNTGNIVENLYTGGGCSFSNSGNSTLSLTAGQQWGIIVTGDHFDGTNLLNGRFEIYNFISRNYTLTGATTGTGTSLDGVEFSPGTTQVSWIVEDKDGNTSTCSFNITVEDNEAPTITCPEDITTTATNAVVNFDNPTVTDNVSSSFQYVSPGMTYIGRNGGKNFFISDQSFSGANAFADAVARGGFVATINDATQNAFIANALQANGITEAHIGYSDAASEGNFEWQDGSTSTYENWLPGEPNNTDGGEDYVTISSGGRWNDVGARGTGNVRYIFQLDQNDGFLIQTNGLASGSSFPIGVTTNTFEAHDAAGNNSSCSFDVTITDIPTVSTQNIDVDLDSSGNATITAASINDGSSAVSGISDLSIDVSTFECSNLGENTVTLTVTSNSGETATGTAIVTVIDNIAPTLVLQDVTVELSAEGTVSVDASAFDNGSFDNCGEITFSTNLVETLSCGSLGLIEVTVTATDASGNQSQNTAILTVEDNLSPAVVTQDITVELDVNGAATITAAQVENGSSDNCGVDSLVLDVTTFDCSDLGENTVTLTVTDASGNEASATAIVTVIDNVLPTVVTQAFTVELDASGSATITTADVDNGSADNCSIDNLALDVTTFDCSNLGENTVTLTATDASGNEASTTAMVTVVDVSGPVLVTQDITVNLDENGSVTILPSDVLSSVEDNCTISQDITLSLDQDTFTAIGVYVVNLTSTDASGNSITAAAEVTVDNTLSVDDIDLNVEIKLYPNPASDNIYFEISNAKIQSISIYDINGRLIKTSDNISINVSELSSGIYFAKVEGERMKTFKVLRFIKK